MIICILVFQWSRYTSRQLKKPVNKKLWPKVINSNKDFKEKYYIAKTSLIEKQLEAVNRDELRKEEKHKKKMKLLDLEIEHKTKENLLM